jgi:hypothetical protein
MLIPILMNRGVDGTAVFCVYLLNQERYGPPMVLIRLRRMLSFLSKAYPPMGHTGITPMRDLALGTPIWHSKRGSPDVLASTTLLLPSTHLCITYVDSTQHSGSCSHGMKYIHPLYAIYHSQLH